MSKTLVSTLRAQGAKLDEAARAASGVRRTGPVRAAASSAAKPLGLVWVVAPSSRSLVAAGIEKALENKADVRIGENPGTGSPSCVLLYAESLDGGLAAGMGRVRKAYPGVPLLVLGARLDLALAFTALKNGADGFVHAAMDREQVARAVRVAQKGELVAPRRLLLHLLSQDAPPDVGALSVRQREVVEMVAEGESNAEIAKRLYLSESTVKQHLRAAYKALGVRNRTEAAKAMRAIRDHARGV